MTNPIVGLDDATQLEGKKGEGESSLTTSFSKVLSSLTTLVNGSSDVAPRSSVSLLARSLATIAKIYAIGVVAPGI